MYEIGGYIELEQMHGREYYFNAISLNTARNALKYVIIAYKIKKIYLPYFICETVSDVCKEYKIKIEYYHINKFFQPEITEMVENNSYVYIVNYYGLLSHNDIIFLKEKFKNIILDQAHAFFQKPLNGIITIYSCRKFFGVPDGAYLYTEKTINKFLEVDVSFNRMLHIIGRYDTQNGSNFYKNFRDVEDSFKKLPLKKMSRITHNILRSIDYKFIYKTRKNNFEILKKEFAIKNKDVLNLAKGLYCYPLYVKDGLNLRKKLLEEKIYIPLLWNEVLNNESNELEKDYAANILSIPIDQRYTKKDMYYIIKIIRKYLD